MNELQFESSDFKLYKIIIHRRTIISRLRLIFNLFDSSNPSASTFIYIPRNFSISFRDEGRALKKRFYSWSIEKRGGDYYSSRETNAGEFSVKLLLTFLNTFIYGVRSTGVQGATVFRVSLALSARSGAVYGRVTNSRRIIEIGEWCTVVVPTRSPRR